MFFYQEPITEPVGRVVRDRRASPVTTAYVLCAIGLLVVSGLTLPAMSSRGPESTLGPVKAPENSGTKTSSSTGLVAPDRAPALARSDTPHPSPTVTAAATPLAGLEWVHIAASGSPPPRLWGGITFDESDGYVLMFGGVASNGTYLNDTWRFSVGAWVQVTSESAPSPRRGPAIAYDVADGYVVLFGGADPNVGIGDTWIFKGGEWTELHPAVSPPARASASMVYDPQLHGLLLFGGTSNHCCGGDGLNDTWLFAAGQWTQLATKGAAPPVNAYGLSFDEAQNRALVFGGWNPNTQGESNQTWAFNGTNWFELPTPAGLGTRQGVGMTFDQAAHETILFGGLSSSGACPTSNPNCGDTWVNVGGAWSRLDQGSGPDPRGYAEVCYDGLDGAVLVFGGADSGGVFGDTWMLESSVSSSGSGLVGEYWSNSFFGHPAVDENGQPLVPAIAPPTAVRVDLGINTGTETGYQWHPFGYSYFSVRWTGLVYTPLNGTYSFQCHSDDSCWLYIDAVPIIVGNLNAGIYSGTGNITSGLHFIEVDYYENGAGPAGINLNWSEPGSSSLGPIPAADLSSPGATVRLSAHVVDSGQHSLATANVSVGTLSGSTNSSGLASFELFPGTYDVSATEAGYLSASQSVVLSGNLSVTLTLARPYNFVGVIPPSNLNITVTPTGYQISVLSMFTGSPAVIFFDWQQVGVLTVGAGWTSFDSPTLPTLLVMAAANGSTDFPNAWYANPMSPVLAPTSGSSGAFLAEPTPYAAGSISVVPDPVVVGQPATVAVTLHDPGSSTLSIDRVDFEISGLNVGGNFWTSIGAVSGVTIQPSQTSVFSVQWGLPVAGHHCVRVIVSYSGGQGSQAIQRNLDIEPNQLPGESGSVSFALGNQFQSAEIATVSVIQDAPAGWTSTLDINGASYSPGTPISLSLPAGAMVPATLTIMPSVANPGTGTFDVQEFIGGQLVGGLRKVYTEDAVSCSAPVSNRTITATHLPALAVPILIPLGAFPTADTLSVAMTVLTPAPGASMAEFEAVIQSCYGVQLNPTDLGAAFAILSWGGLVPLIQLLNGAYNLTLSWLLGPVDLMDKFGQFFDSNHNFNLFGYVEWHSIAQSFSSEFQLIAPLIATLVAFIAKSSVPDLVSGLLLLLQQVHAVVNLGAGVLEVAGPASYVPFWQISLDSIIPTLSELLAIAENLDHVTGDKISLVIDAVKIFGDPEADALTGVQLAVTSVDLVIDILDAAAPSTGLDDFTAAFDAVTTEIDPAGDAAATTLSLRYPNGSSTSLGYNATTGSTTWEANGTGFMIASGNYSKFFFAPPVSARVSVNGIGPLAGGEVPYAFHVDPGVTGIPTTAAGTVAVGGGSLSSTLEFGHLSLNNTAEWSSIASLRGVRATAGNGVVTIDGSLSPTTQVRGVSVSVYSDWSQVSTFDVNGRSFHTSFLVPGATTLGEIELEVSSPGSLGEAYAVPLPRTEVTYAEDGLPPGLPWSVSIGLLNFSSESSANTISLPNGIYDYLLHDVGNLVATPAAGRLILNGTPVLISVAYRVGYNVTFSEVGLPSNDPWSVAVGGSKLPIAAAPGMVHAVLLDGSYHFFAIGPVGYRVASPLMPNVVTVSGSNVTVTIHFLRGASPTLTIREVGLPTGIAWCVELDFALHVCTRGATVSIAGLTGGTYPYTVSPLTGAAPSGQPGSVNLASQSRAISVHFAPTEYSVTFHEVGLASGRHWGVFVYPGVRSSSLSTITFRLANGSYLFSLLAQRGIQDIPSGEFNVSGLGLTINVGFALVTYSVVFTETGLPAGTTWTVRVGSSILSTNRSTVSLQLGNGTYPVSVGAVAGFLAQPSKSILTVHGGPRVASIHFAPVAVHAADRKSSPEPTGSPTTVHRTAEALLGGPVAIRREAGCGPLPKIAPRSDRTGHRTIPAADHLGRLVWEPIQRE